MIRNLNHNTNIKWPVSTAGMWVKFLIKLNLFKATGRSSQNSNNGQKFMRFSSISVIISKGLFIPMPLKLLEDILLEYSHI
jgi:hypothetical protein